MKDFISIYDDVFTQEQCNKFIEYIDLFQQRSLLKYDRGKKHAMDQMTSNLAMHYQFPAWSWVGDNFFSQINPIINDYFTEYSILNNKKFLLYDVKVKKIPLGGGFHNWHFEDGGVMQAARLFVVQVYLNTIEEGGETEFLYMNKRVKAEAGRVIVFPTAFTHTHRGNPPIGQDKYIATSWGWVQDEE